MKKSILALLLAVLMVASLLTIGAAADEPVKGSTAEHPFTTVEEYKTAIAGGSWNGKDIYLKIDGQQFNGSGFNLTNVQSWETPPELHLTITNCKFTGNTAQDVTNPSFMYLSNCKELYIEDCTFDAGSTGLTYGINWNLIQITGATVVIKDSTFTGVYRENAIKLNQRNGADDKAKDIKYDSWNGNIIAASIESALIENVKINSDVAVILLGSAAKGDGGAAAPSTGAFPVTISNVTTTSEYGVVVFEAYLANSAAEAAAKAALASGSISAVSDYVKVMDANDTISKTANGDLAKDEDFVAEVNGDKYTSLESALAAVTKDSDTVTLLQDVTLAADTYTIDNSLVIKSANGSTITVNELDKTLFVISNGKTLTFDGANITVNGKDDETDSIAFDIRSDSTLAFKNAVVTLNDIRSATVMPGGASSTVDIIGSNVAVKNNRGNFSNGGVFNIEGSTISMNGVGDYGFSCYGLTADNSSITLNDVGTSALFCLNTNGSGKFAFENGSVVTIINSGYDLPVVSTYSKASYVVDVNTVNNENAPLNLYVDASSSVILRGNKTNAINLGTGVAEIYGQLVGSIVSKGNCIVTVDGSVYSVVKSGDTVTLPAAPRKSGYAFLGWSDGTTTYDALATVTITADTTFTASWVRHPDTEYVPEPEEPVEPETPTFPFYDVSSSAWYYSAVKYVYENKLMDGVDTYVFAPNDTLTRAMVWTIIARMSGVDTTGGNTWYAKAQEWVITNGISDGENPTAAITRQELVTMLYRYAQIKGYDVSVGEDTNILSYVDATSISEYAMSAFQWACGSGLTEGDENGALTPLATATRAQAAAMIMRFCESVK